MQKITVDESTQMNRMESFVAVLSLKQLKYNNMMTYYLVIIDELGPIGCLNLMFYQGAEGVLFKAMGAERLK